MISGKILREAIISGANNINNQRSRVDELNVFPVPDGDTGTNMSMTLNAASTELEELLLETQIQMKNIQPTLTLLSHPKLNESYMQKVVESIRGGSGQPQILNNNVGIQRNLARFSQYEGGITLEDARNCGNYG